MSYVVTHNEAFLTNEGEELVSVATILTSGGSRFQIAPFSGSYYLFSDRTPGNSEAWLMCYCGDGDPPSVFTSAIRKARKPRPCSECRDGILPGEYYEAISGCWDGSWSHFSVCARCYWDDAWLGCDCRLFGHLRDDLHSAGLEPSPITYRSAA
jgi:hypothetical protein